jgi:hypothetical protein
MDFEKMGLDLQKSFTSQDEEGKKKARTRKVTVKPSK